MIILKEYYILKKNLTNFIYDLEFKKYAAWYGKALPLQELNLVKQNN